MENQCVLLSGRLVTGTSIFSAYFKSANKKQLYRELFLVMPVPAITPVRGYRPCGHGSIIRHRKLKSNNF
jgi:hypothetical protein